MLRWLLGVVVVIFHKYVDESSPSPSTPIEVEVKVQEAKPGKGWGDWLPPWGPGGIAADAYADAVVAKAFLNNECGQEKERERESLFMDVSFVLQLLQA